MERVDGPRALRDNVKTTPSSRLPKIEGFSRAASRRGPNAWRKGPRSPATEALRSRIAMVVSKFSAGVGPRLTVLPWKVVEVCIGAVFKCQSLSTALSNRTFVNGVAIPSSLLLHSDDDSLAIKYEIVRSSTNWKLLFTRRAKQMTDCLAPGAEKGHDLFQYQAAPAAGG